MPKQKLYLDKYGLPQPGRKHKLKYITILPSLITILNGVCGFGSIALAADNKFEPAGYLILLAMIADVLDGQIARLSKSSSTFGGQLDSLCDIISFGAAPAFLMLRILKFKLAVSEFELLERFVWLAAAAYMCCTAIRLARFNVENARPDHSHNIFTGLPSPAAAGVIATLIIFQQETIPRFFIQSSTTYKVLENSAIYSLPILSLLLAALMVSRIKYQHIINQYLSGKKPLTHLVWLLVGLGIVIWNLQLALTLLFCGFAASGPVKWLYFKITHKKEKLLSLAQHQPATPAAPAMDPSPHENP